MNSREDAAIVWMIAIFCFAVFKDPRGVGVSLWACFRALAHWKLLVLFGSTLLYSALIVYGASWIGLWHTAALKATIYWFIITGVVLVGEAVGRFASPSEPKFRRKVLGRVISVTIVIEFLVNLYAFPLAYELVLTLIAITAIGLQVVLQRDPAADANVRDVVDSAIVILGVIVLAHFLVRALTDLDGLLV